MSPAEANDVVWEEPDWRALFEEQCARWPKLPRYLQEDSAFTEILRQWRKFHWSPIVVDDVLKKNPASAVQAIVALAAIGIMPPRSAWTDQPRTDETGAYQRDDHCWLSIASEQWRITGIEDRTLHLQKGFQADVERKQIDLAQAKWDKHNAAAVEILNAMIKS